MSEYDFVQRGTLKLKGVADGGVKKKKKKHKKSSETRDSGKGPGSLSKADGEALSFAEAAGESAGGSSSSSGKDKEAVKFYSSKTKAELAFLKRQEVLGVERIKTKASVSHKEKVEKFNAYLNSLSEHYEPAKVSWTK